MNTFQISASNQKPIWLLSNFSAKKLSRKDKILLDSDVYKNSNQKRIQPFFHFFFTNTHTYKLSIMKSWNIFMTLLTSSSLLSPSSSPSSSSSSYRETIQTLNDVCYCSILSPLSIHWEHYGYGRSHHYKAITILQTHIINIIITIIIIVIKPSQYFIVFHHHQHHVCATGPMVHPISLEHSLRIRALSYITSLQHHHRRHIQNQCWSSYNSIISIHTWHFHQLWEILQKCMRRTDP